MCFVKIKIYMKKINSKFFVLSLSLLNLSCGGDVKDEEDESNNKNKEKSSLIKSVSEFQKAIKELEEKSSSLLKEYSGNILYDPLNKTEMENLRNILSKDESKKEFIGNQLKKIDEDIKKLEEKKKSTK